MRGSGSGKDKEHEDGHTDIPSMSGFSSLMLMPSSDAVRQTSTTTVRGERRILFHRAMCLLLGLCANSSKKISVRRTDYPNLRGFSAFVLCCCDIPEREYALLARYFCVSTLRPLSFYG